MRIEIDRLTLRHGGRAVFSELSCTFVAGSVAWVVGENGDGKSTLLRILAQRMRATSGSVRWRGFNADDAITYYHPRMNVPPGTTYAEWTRLLTAMSPVEKPLAVPGFLPAVPSDRLLTEVSTGEAKRILLHALLTRATEVTVLDEPYEHLSSAAKQALTHVLLERARNSIVVVATNQDIPEQGNVPQVFRLPGGGAGEEISRLSVEA